MMGKVKLAVFFGVAVALVGTVGAQTCTGGIAGVQATSLDICCTLACGVCGGPGCTPATTSELTASDCCATEVAESGVLCSDTGAAPCILTTEAASADSVCINGQTGVQDPDTDVCCPLECGDFCGGEGCGTIPGVEASQCCAAAIISSGSVCDGATTPCVVVDGTFTPAPSAPGATMAPTTSSRDLAFTQAPIPASQTPVPSATAAPLAPGATIAPTAGSSDFAFTAPPTRERTLAPTPTSSFANIDSVDSKKGSTSDSTPIVAGVVSGVAGAALIALMVFLKRRRASKQKITHPRTLLPIHDNNPENGGEQPPNACPPTSVVLAVGNGGGNSPSHPHNTSSHRGIQAETDGFDGGDIVPSSAPAALAVPTKSRTEHGTDVVEHYGAGLAGDDTAGSSAKPSLTTTSSGVTTSTADVSTGERAELAQFQQTQSAASIASEPQPEEASGCNEAYSSADRQKSAGDIGLGHAVLAAAQELAHHCQVPGISEAASVVCIMANLVIDSRGIDSGSDSRLRQYRSIVMVLNRAAKVVGQAADTTVEATRVLIEDVHDAIFDVVELIKTFQSKNKLSKLVLSTLFKRRLDELDDLVDRTIIRLQLGLQLQAGHDVSAVKDSVKAVEEGMLLYKGSTAEATSESVAEARRIRRQRKLDSVEIPEDQVIITDDLLGRGGFGEVYLADYNGHNAAAKVLRIPHDGGMLDENQQQLEANLRRAFVRELEAMIRLRSPNTVNVFGAVTSLPDSMVLVMELLSGGDLLTLLRKSKEPLPEEQCRRIIGDICAGMAFLHSKNAVHGDLKSANVLLDGGGRAKIGDFGTSRWSQHTNSTGLATYATKSGRSNQMSLAWSAPEVLEEEGSTYASDVYSFGIVVWEVLSRKLPWSNKTRPREILSAVLRGVRPSFHVDAPADIVDMARACWGGEPEDRTTFSAILEDMKAKGWSE